MRGSVLRVQLVLGGALLLGCGSGQAPADAASQSERLDAWFAERFEEELDFDPVRKTLLGRDDDQDRWPDFSEEAQDAQLAWRRASVDEMRARFDRDALTPEARTSWAIWEARLARAEAAHAFRRHAYVFHQMNGPQAGLPNVLVSFQRVEDEADLEDYVARIAALGPALDQLLERARRAAADGIRPPAFAYDAALRQARRVVTGAPFEAGQGDSPIWANLRERSEALVEEGALDEARAAALRARARAALLDGVGPAYARLVAWLEADRPDPARDAGVWALPDGDAFYAERLAFHTTTRLDAEAIHRLGLDEVARIRAEMEALKQRVGFEGELPAFFEFVRSDPRFFFPDTDAGRQAYLDGATAHLEAIERRLPEWFGLRPRAKLVVKRVEPFREQDGAPQHYFPGTPDGSRPGVYYAHLSDMSAVPKNQMEVIAYHEGNPGHHLQLSIAQEREGIPRFRTQSSYFTAYVEGWALYAELLAKEMGAYADPYADFGRLTTEMWRAIRLVVDTGLHHRRWGEDRAVAFFMANSPEPEESVRAEVRRYLVLPGQATSYKIGMLRILELRERARRVLGPGFDIRAFHDTVLGGGSLPLGLLEARVDAWIAAANEAAGSPSPTPDAAR